MGLSKTARPLAHTICILALNIKIPDIETTIYRVKDKIRSVVMDPNTAPAPDFISSLEAMIQASTTSVLDRRLGPAGDDLDARIEAAVATALDRRLGPALESLGDRMTSLVEQRLSNAVGTLNQRVTSSVAAALEQRLGPAAGALTAQITFTSAPFPALPFTTPPEAQALGQVNGPKETKRVCLPEELGKAIPVENGTFIEKEPSRQKQGPDDGTPSVQERSAEDAVCTQQTKDTGVTGKEQPAQKQNANVSETSQTTCSELANESVPPPALSARWKNMCTSKESATIQSGGSKSTAYQLVADSPRKREAGPSVVLTAKPDSKTAGQSSSVAQTPNKRKANQKYQVSEGGELESSLLGAEKANYEQPMEKRAKFKLDPPGYTDGPPILFRRIPHTDYGQKRGYPRIVDLDSFTERSNKQDLTMADIVATFLFNYDRSSLDAFMDRDKFPIFNLIRRESDSKTRDFVIERRRDDYGVVVRVCDRHQIPGSSLLTNRTVRVSRFPGRSCQVP